MSVIDAKHRFSRHFRVEPSDYHANLINRPPSAIDAVKREWNRQVDTMRTSIHYTPRSYEDVLVMQIKLHQWRAEGCQDSGDYETAALEIAFADGLIRALNEYRMWGM